MRNQEHLRHLLLLRLRYLVLLLLLLLLRLRYLEHQVQRNQLQ
jgi:hypothetical protein